MSSQSEYRISFHIENAARAATDIKSVGDAMSEMDSQFKSSKSGIDSAEQSLADFSSSVSQVKSPMDQLGSSIDQLGQSSQQLGSSINPLSGEFTALSDNLSRVDSSLKTSNTSLQQAGQGFQQLGQQVQTSNAPLAQFGQGMQMAGQSTQEFVGVLSTVGSSLGTISGDITAVGTSLAVLGDSSGDAAGALSSLGSSFGSIESDMSSLVGSSSALGHAFSEIESGVQGASGGLDQYNTLLGQTTQEIQTTETSAKTLGSSFMSQVGGITAVVGAGTSLFLMYNNLVQAQNQVNRANVMLEAVQLRQQRALIALNKAIAEHGQHSQQAAIALQAYEVATGRVEVASARLEQTQVRQNVSWATFAQQIIPQVATSVGSVVGIFGALTRENTEGVSALDRLRDAFSGAGTEASEFGSTAGELGNNLATMSGGLAETGVGLGKLGTSFGTLSKMIKDTTVSVKGMAVAFLTNPFTLLATAIAAVIGTIAAFTYNIGGARDAINGFGVAVGNAIPFLKPLLDWFKLVGLGFQQLAGTLSQGGTLIINEFGEIVKASESSMAAATLPIDEFGRTIETTLPASVNSGVNQVIASFKRMTMELTSSFKEPVQDTIDFFKQHFGDIITIVSESSDVIGELGLRATDSLVTMNDAVMFSGQNFGELGDKLQVVDKGAGKFQITAGTMRTIMTATGMTAEQVIDVFNRMGFELHTMNDAVTAVVGGNKVMEASWQAVSEVAGLVEERLAALVQINNGELGPSAENAAGALLTQQLTMEALGQTTETFTAAQQKAYDMMRTGIDTTADLNTRYEQWKATMDSTVPSINELANGFNQQSESMRLMGAVHDVVAQQVTKSTESLRLQNTVLQNTAPAAIATKDSMIALVDGVSQLITPTEVVNSILRQQSSELNNATGFMEFYRNGVEQSGISLITFIDTMEDAGLISSEVADQLREQGVALGLITEEEIKATEATKEHVTVLQELINSNKELATSLAETAAGIREGTLLQEAYNQGVLQTQIAHEQSIQSLATARGELQRYNQLLAEGKIQSVAFAEGVNEVIAAFQAMDESMANIEGQIMAYDVLLESGQATQTNFNLGLRQGQLDARNWWSELKQADGAILGMETGIRALAEQLNIELPAGMERNIEASQRFIGVMSGSTTAVREFEQSIIDTASAITDSLIVGLDDLDDDVEDAVDDLADTWEETLGEKMPKATQKALEQVGKDKSWGAAAQFGVDQMKTVIDDPEGFAEAFEAVTEGLEKQMDELGPKVAAEAQAVMDAIKAVAQDPHNSELWINVETAIANLNAAAAELDLSSPFETGKESAVKYSQEIDNVIERINALKTAPGLKQFATPEQFLVSPATIESQLAAEEKLAATPGAPIVDTTAATQALDQLKAHALQVVGEINTAFTSFSQTWPALVGSAVAMIQPHFDTLSQNAQLAVGQMNLAFTSLGQTWPPIVASAVEAVNAQLQTLAQNVQLVIGQMNLAFTSLGQTWPAIIASAIEAVNAQLATLSQNVQLAVGQMNLAFTSIQQTWPPIMASTAASVNAEMQSILSTAVDVMNQVAQTATHVESIWTSTFGRIVNMVTSSMSQINSALDGTISHAEAVAAAIARIGDSADQARSSVDQLAQAINSLQDRTITITTRYETIGTPPVGGAGGIGSYGGHTYLPMAGGSGISDAGFAPIVIDHPTKLLVGESGPELVSVTPINRNRNGRTGEISPFADMSFAKGTGDFMSTQGGVGTQIQTDTVVFDANQGPIQILQGGAGTLTPGSAGSPLGFGNTNVPLGTGQGGTFNVPGGQVAVSGNAVACVNGQCFGNMQGFGPQLPSTTTGGTLGQGQEPFKPVFDETGAIKAIETLIEWFKFLGLPTGASVPGTGNFTPGTGGTITGRGAFAQAGMGAFAGQISMQGGQIVFDSNQGKMQVETTTGAISIAGPGGAFAQAGNARAGVGIFGIQDNTTEQLTQLNKTMQNVSGSLQAVGNSMASLGNEVVFGNQQLQQTLQGPNTLTGGQPVTFQQSPVSLFGAGNQVGFQSFPGGGAVGAGGAAGNPLGFLNSMLGGFGIANPFSGVTPTTGAPATGGTGTGGTIGTGTGGCSVCGAANGLQGAASDLSGVANQLGNVMTSGNGVGATFPGTAGGGSIPTTAGGGGGMLGGTQPGTGAGCACSCMPMDSDPNRYKIEDGAGNDCNNHIYFDSIEQCHSRLNEICPGENTTTPTPTPTTPTPQPSGPILGGGNVSAMAQGGMAMASAGGVTVTAGGGILGGQTPVGQIPGQTGLPIGNPPVPPSIVKSVGLPSQAPDVNQDPESWQIVESAGTVGTYDIIDDSGDVVQLGFRTLSAAQEYLNYFISYYKWVKSGSTGIPGPVPVGIGVGTGGGIGTGGIGTGGIGTGGITAGTGNIMASAGGGGAFAQAGNAIAQAGSLFGNALGFGSQKKLGPTPVPDMPFEEIPRAQGPFRSGQDTQEEGIFDNSRIRMGADVYDSGTVSMEDIEGGGGGGKKKKPRFTSRLQLHVDTARAIAGEHSAYFEEFLRRIEIMFGNLALNLALNVGLDGNNIYKSQKKYLAKDVGLFT